MPGPFGLLGGRDSGGMGGELSPVSRNEFEELKGRMAQRESVASDMGTTIQRQAGIISSLEQRIAAQNTTITNLQSQLSTYAKTSQLANYITKSEVASQFATFVSSSQFTSGVDNRFTNAMNSLSAGPGAKLKVIIDQLSDGAVTRAFGGTTPNSWFDSKKATVYTWVDGKWNMTGVFKSLGSIFDNNTTYFGGCMDSSAIARLRDTLPSTRFGRIKYEATQQTYSKPYNMKFLGFTISSTTVSGTGIREFVQKHFDKAESADTAAAKLAWSILGIKAFVEASTDWFGYLSDAGVSAIGSLNDTGNAFEKITTGGKNIGSAKNNLTGYPKN